MKKLKVTLASLCFLGLWACQGIEKEEETISPNAPLPRAVTTTRETELLVGKWWRLEQAIVTPAYPKPNGSTNNWLEGKQTCELDNRIRFNLDGTMTWDEGAIRCSGTEQTTPGAWTYNTKTGEVELYEQEGSKYAHRTDLTVTQVNVTTFTALSMKKEGPGYTITSTYVLEP
ncbi:hypothetical protein [Sabulibacter ruber]|uniref:hypothetical protein n=1 Tax=Sabulibacter ruber TaxID=2811901 RepID=UPI001A96A76F|nr:hypothetical protein [Sabulibacter ruber]